MTTPIQFPTTSIEPGSTISLPSPTGTTPPVSGGKSFSDVLGGLVDSVNTLQQEAGRLEKAMYAGEVGDLHRVMIASEEAGVAFELLLEVRNKLVETYQELMRMPM